MPNKDAHKQRRRPNQRWKGSAICKYCFDTVINGAGLTKLGIASLLVVAAYFGYGAFDIINSLAIRVLAQRVECDARAELYLSLLGKSQTFHSRQRVGDLMARHQ